MSRGFRGIKRSLIRLDIHFYYCTLLHQLSVVVFYSLNVSLQLIDDKKVLSERCEQLVKQLRELDKKYKTNVKTLEEKNSSEMSKLKQVTAAAEKLRREKWKSDETQRIKEATVKSLEPEIQRIIAKGKAEVQKLKAVHEADMLQVDERASRRFVVQMEELRAQCAEEKEQACAHERELARQRWVSVRRNGCCVTYRSARSLCAIQTICASG